MDLFEGETFSSQTDAALIATRSRRDKDMSDDKAIKRTIQDFLGGKFYISHDITDQKGDGQLFVEIAFFLVLKTLICRVVGTL